VWARQHPSSLPPGGIVYTGRSHPGQWTDNATDRAGSLETTPPRRARRQKRRCRSSRIWTEFSPIENPVQQGCSSKMTPNGENDVQGRRRHPTSKSPATAFAYSIPTPSCMRTARHSCTTATTALPGRYRRHASTCHAAITPPLLLLAANNANTQPLLLVCDRRRNAPRHSCATSARFSCSAPPSCSSPRPRPHSLPAPPMSAAPRRWTLVPWPRRRRAPRCRGLDAWPATSRPAP
jgi:hypothetical protein